MVKKRREELFPSSRTRSDPTSNRVTIVQIALVNKVHLVNTDAAFKTAVHEHIALIDRETSLAGREVISVTIAVDTTATSKALPSTKEDEILTIGFFPKRTFRNLKEDLVMPKKVHQSLLDKARFLDTKKEAGRARDILKAAANAIAPVQNHVEVETAIIDSSP